MPTECETDKAAVPDSAAADADKTPTGIECLTPSPDTARDARAYWTPERMRNAKPLPTPTLDPGTLKPVDPE